MPIKSSKQFRLMEAAAHDASYGPSKEVADEMLSKTSHAKKSKLAKKNHGKK